MIILSIGMPRAGSGWYYNLTNDLMLAGSAQDARRIRQRYHLQSILTEVNCNIGAFTPRRLMLVLLPALMGNTFVIKAHAGPTPLALFLARRGLLRPTYIYRDPRDAMLSAFENGERARRDGRSNAFSHLVDFETSLEFMQQYVYISEAWIACPQALHTRYEDLLTDYDTEVKRLVNFLPLQPDDPGLQEIIEKYRPESSQPDQKGLHFSKGKIGRFRQKMSAEQQTRMAQVFSAYLEQMNYNL
ncbi:MAG: sulfotransferase domain-containing protein [Chloroflexota bacterium]